MFENIGAKIKGVTVFLFVVMSLISVACGVVTFMQEGIAGLLVGVVGVVLAWISSLAMYGFGQLIENTDIIADSIKKERAKPVQPMFSETNRPVKRAQDQKREIDSNGMWTCPHCGAINDRSRDKCKECGR